MEERREYFGVPAAAGSHLDHRHVWLDAEELQRFDRVAVLIARLVRSRTPVAADGLLQRRGGAVGCGRGGGTGGAGQ
jgi:hypothetical protein